MTGVIGVWCPRFGSAAGVQNAELELGGPRVGRPRVGHRNAELELSGPIIDGSMAWKKNEALYNSFHVRGEVMY